jgi:ribosomal protein S18 acetylase RimI-like enzyme
MGRLAVGQEFQGQGLGAALLADALSRACNSQIAAFALLVDAKDQHAANFYLRHGFIAFPSTPLRLFLPLATVKNLHQP